MESGGADVVEFVHLGCPGSLIRRLDRGRVAVVRDLSGFRVSPSTPDAAGALVLIFSLLRE